MQNKILFLVIFFLFFFYHSIKAEVTFFEKCSFIIYEKAITKEEIDKLIRLFQLNYIKEGPFYIFYGPEKNTMLILVDELKTRKIVKNEEDLIISCVKKEFFTPTFLINIVKTLPQYKMWENEEKVKKILLWISRMKGVKIEEDRNLEFLKDEFLKDVKILVDNIKNKCVYFSQTFEEIPEIETSYDSVLLYTKEIYNLCPLPEIKEFMKNL